MTASGNSRKITALRLAVTYPLIVACVLFLGILSHELGHGLTAVVLGSSITHLEVTPGIQLYPRIALTNSDRSIGVVKYDPLWPAWKEGLALLMGSGANAVLGYCGILFLYVRKPKGLLRVAMLVISLFSVDITAYSVLPRLGLRHAIVIGGADPEPWFGAAMLGVSEWAFYGGIAAHAVVSGALLVNYAIRNRRLRETRYARSGAAG